MLWLKANYFCENSGNNENKSSFHFSIFLNKRNIFAKVMEHFSLFPLEAQNNLLQKVFMYIALIVDKNLESLFE